MTNRNSSGKQDERVYCEELFKELKLPADRIKTVMRSSPDVEKLTTDSLYIMTKAACLQAIGYSAEPTALFAEPTGSTAAELFIQDLAHRAYVASGKENTIDYKHIADVVQSETPFEFVREMVPHKITYREYKEMKKQKERLK